MRKRFLPILGLVLIAACRREPDFDERYDAANEKIRNTAMEIDRQVAETGTPTPSEAAQER